MIKGLKIIKSNTQRNIIPLPEYIELSGNGLLYAFYQEFAIQESLKNSLLTPINEKYGVYDGQIKMLSDLSISIIDALENNHEISSFYLNKNDLKDYKNIFYEYFCIRIKDNCDSSYLPERSKYNPKTKLFDQVIIDINYTEINFGNYKSILKILVHEMTHAWQNYLMNVKGKSLSDFSGDDQKYRINLNSKSHNIIENICKEILYMTESFEINAFLSEISTTLEKCLKDEYQNIKNDINKDFVESSKIISYKDAYKLFTETHTYKKYAELRSAFYQIDESKIKQIRDIFVNYYNKVNKTNLTWNKIYKIINNKFIKIFNKFDTNVPKLYYEYYEHMQKQFNEGLWDDFRYGRFINEYDELSKNTKHLNLHTE